MKTDAQVRNQFYARMVNVMYRKEHAENILQHVLMITFNAQMITFHVRNHLINASIRLTVKLRAPLGVSVENANDIHYSVTPLTQTDVKSV